MMQIDSISKGEGNIQVFKTILVTFIPGMIFLNEFKGGSDFCVPYTIIIMTNIPNHTESMNK